MRQMFKILSLVILTCVLAACQSESNDFAYTALEEVERIDAPVSIPIDTQFLAMDDKAKLIIYESLDLIGTNGESTASPTDYSHIDEIASENEYIDFLQQTSDQASLIYLGFDECPWCKAFSPKINQLASEFDVPVYYYNTRSREKDATFVSSMENFGVETVPYVFTIEDGKPKERINQMSSMQQIEDFFSLYTEKY